MDFKKKSDESQKTEQNIKQDESQKVEQNQKKEPFKVQSPSLKSLDVPALLTKNGKITKVYYADKNDTYYLTLKFLGGIEKLPYKGPKKPELDKVVTYVTQCDETKGLNEYNKEVCAHYGSKVIDFE